ncbi:unnamed protein product [Spirodela intermedia]|uniref:Uncharacterized protein n=1 Tax=Spirodela intermedia TaxID=51605 RepID=A0ABN7ECW5_SPIIN|nr:unnamed protein product [Spirodela intermedia]
MGAGGRMFAEEESRPLSRYSTKGNGRKPPFTLGDLKRAIPPHCFERSALRSFSHLARDLILSATLLYLAISFIPLLPSRLQIVAWPVYWAAQGACGHNAFSPYALLDDIVGMVLHSALLIPYFSWKYSHRHHHTNTNNIDLDEVWVPRPSQPVPPGQVPEQPLGRVRWLVGRAHGRWPLYLAFNIESRFYDRFASHYDPYGIYNDRERTQVIISDLGVLATVALLLKLCAAYSPAAVVGLYVLPWMVANGFIVVTSYLQHTHPSLPHYDSSEWEWFKGALATVDRDFGPVLNKVLHNFTETHYYQFDRTPVLKAMWREANECLFVQPDQGSDKSGVFWYSNKLCTGMNSERCPSARW